MLKIRENINIKDLHSFGISFENKYWIDFDSHEELVSLLHQEPFNQLPHRIVGSGTNILFLPHFYGVLLHAVNQSITIIGENKDDVIVEVDAGVEWDSLVEWAVENNFYGIENLSLIPGTVGGAVVQNIGAYGREIEQNIEEVEAINLRSGDVKIFDRRLCSFSYRKSVFKDRNNKDYLVWKVRIKLSRKPDFNISYGNLADSLRNYGELNLSNLRNVIIDIRRSKLPDPKLIGNAGSFFKNPVIDLARFNELLKKYPDIPSYPTPLKALVKIPAGWLIEKAGLKGYRQGDAGVYEKQALVLVNHGNASGLEIFELSTYIQSKVLGEFGINIEPEVTIIGLEGKAEG